jgi:hypothetical protein
VILEVNSTGIIAFNVMNIVPIDVNDREVQNRQEHNVLGIVISVIPTRIDVQLKPSHAIFERSIRVKETQIDCSIRPGRERNFETKTFS